VIHIYPKNEFQLAPLSSNNHCIAGLQIAEPKMLIACQPLDGKSALATASFGAYLVKQV